MDLPLTIPIVNIKRIYQPSAWFIIISIITNLLLSFAISQYYKKTDGTGKKVS